jgi:FtsP/CotA-like multicopper oxidase with cupredoxin domain/plastocyanin
MTILSRRNQTNKPPTEEERDKTMPDIWIQLENRPWDASPNNIDRMMGQDMKEITGKDPVDVKLSATNTRKMFAPLRDDKGDIMDALILRRYKPPKKADESDAWTVPDDRKVNPWDLNEQDPTDTGTMGTIPGPVIECNVGDSVVVHFRNMDMRTMLGTEQICFPFPFIGEICLPFPTQVPLPVEKRCHSLHPHGFVFAQSSDGAYPLSPADPGQPVAGPPGPDETSLWVGVVPEFKDKTFQGTHKKGDRVPPGGTFVYHWNTLGWPTTAGVWLYHDHSICDTQNVGLGAIGIIVIHNPADPEDVATPDVPPSGSPIQIRCFPFPFDVAILPHQLETLGTFKLHEVAHAMAKPKRPSGEKEHEEAPRAEFLVQDGNLLLEADKKLQFFRRLCRIFYSAPPNQALYLQLFHELKSAGFVINGRKYLGNTPTLIAGQRTKMRFGVVGMGDMFHTFHLHGHRWVLPGPDGNKHAGGGGIGDPNAIQNSALVKAVSQFEDTKIFGPANSFVFTIHEDAGEGSFMRAEPALGEWHMHCHVLNHMETGMMGSLLVIQGGETVTQLPRGVPCEMPMPARGGMGDGGGGGAKTVTVHVGFNQQLVFNPDPVNIKAGDTVQWVWDADDHSTTSDTMIWNSGVHNKGFTFSQPFPNPGTFPYYCLEHGGPGGAGMHGTVIVS